VAEAGAALLSFLATAWLHALALLAAAWCAERAGLVRASAAREWLWRSALLLPLATAALALAADRGALRLRPVALVHALPAARIDDARTAMQDTATGAAPLATRSLASAAPPAPTADASSPARPSPDHGLRALADGIAALAADPRWPLAVALAWLALAAGGALIALRRLARLRRHLRALPQPDDDALLHDARRIARRAGLPRLALAQDPALASPVAVAPDLVGVPGWCAGALTPRQRAAMLAHEAAHLARRDPQRRLLARLAAGLLPTPLSPLALRRLDDLAELQCDAWAAHATGDSRALAECLAECLARGRGLSTPHHAVPMAAADSPLVERVRRLIEENPMPSPALGLPRRLAIAAVLGGVAAATPHVVFGDPTPPAAPSPPTAPASPAASALPSDPPSPPTAPAPPAPPPPALRGSTEITDSWLFGRRLSIDLEGDGYALEVDGRGRFGFNPTEDDLASLDGTLDIEETDGDTTRRVAFSVEDGRIVRRFTVDGDPVADDAAMRAWLARAIPRLLRATGIDAEQRVARIHARGGAEAVLAEVALLPTDHVRRLYLEALFETGPLDAGAQQRAIAAAAAMGSDYEQRQTLEAAIEHQSLGASAQAAVHRVAGAMDSDYERRSLLQAAVAPLRTMPAAAGSWMDALDATQSSYEHRVALESLVDGVPLDPELAARALASAARIGSDYERRNALVRVAAAAADAPGFAARYVEATDGMGSDYETREALLALVEAMAPTADNARAVLDAVGRIGSNYEARVVLTALAARMPNDAALIERYRAAARRLGGHERGVAEQALDRFYET
jgi:beta-lactamase regulating signal transducer with metallopeptidase domain